MIKTIFKVIKFGMFVFFSTLGWLPLVAAILSVLILSIYSVFSSTPVQKINFIIETFVVMYFLCFSIVYFYSLTHLKKTDNHSSKISETAQ